MHILHSAHLYSYRSLPFPDVIFVTEPRLLRSQFSKKSDPLGGVRSASWDYLTPEGSVSKVQCNGYVYRHFHYIHTLSRPVQSRRKKLKQI